MFFGLSMRGVLCYSHPVVQRYAFMLVLVALGWIPGAFAADTFRLNNGDTIVGEMLVASANDSGVQIKVGDGEYQRIPWASFNQEDIRKFAANPKLKDLVEPYVEISQEEKIKRTEVNITQPDRLPRQEDRSLFGAMFGSALGLLVLFLLYAANLYAAYEIALFRARPLPLVCGVSAVAPIIGPIVFLSMPTKLGPSAPAVETVTPEQEAADAAAADLNPMLADGAEHPAGLSIHHDEPAKADLPETVTYQRGQYTFNKRFFETKFPNFFGMARREAEKDLVLVFKTARGEFTATRIVRISASDMHILAHRGAATEEVTVPFGEIQEIKQKHIHAK